MDPSDILIVLAIFVGGTLPVALGLAWYFSHRRLKDLERQLRDPHQDADARLAALEHSVNALADSIEQLASGQEFLHRLIATQNQLPGAQPPRVTTPH